MNEVIKTYIDKIGAGMTCAKKTKKYFLNEMTSVVSEYCSEHPEATVDDLYREFGTPEDFRENLADKEMYAEMLKKAEKKARLFLIIAIGIGIIASLAIVATLLLLRELGGTYVISNIRIED